MLLHRPVLYAQTLRPTCHCGAHRLLAVQWVTLRGLDLWVILIFLQVVVEDLLWSPCLPVDPVDPHPLEHMAALLLAITHLLLWDEDTLPQAPAVPDSHGQCPQADSPRPVRTRHLLEVTGSSHSRCNRR